MDLRFFSAALDADHYFLQNNFSSALGLNPNITIFSCDVGHNL